MPQTALTEALLDEIVRRARQAGNPVRIVLFGSQARHDAGPESDLDLVTTALREGNTLHG